MAFPILAGIATAVLFGWILIAAGAVGLFGAFTSRPRVHFWWSLFSAALAIIAENSSPRSCLWSARSRW